jgi:hypothetical protein
MLHSKCTSDSYFRPFPILPLPLAEPQFGQLRQFHRGQFDRQFSGVAGPLTAGDGREEQRGLRWKAARRVQQLKLAQARVSTLVHGGGWQELERLLDLGRLGVKQATEPSNSDHRFTRLRVPSLNVNRSEWGHRLAP